MTTKRLTLSTVNKAVKAEGINAELVQGSGYLYFMGDDVAYAGSTSVYVNRLNDLPLERWLAEAKDFKAESQANKPYAEAKARTKRNNADPEYHRKMIEGTIRSLFSRYGAEAVTAAYKKVIAE